MLQFTLSIRDKEGNRRFGTDEVWATISRPTVAAALDPPSEDEGFLSSLPFQSTDRFEKQFATQLLGSGVDSGNTGVITRLGTAFDSHSAGDYSFNYTFNEAGVYALQAWVCQGDSISRRSCLPDVPDRVSHKLAVYVGSTEPRLLFTVCAANANSRQQENDNWFIPAAELHRCKCQAGFHGESNARARCHACEQGQYASASGADECDECAPGRFCSSQSSGHFGENNTAACTKCDSCSEGQYQSKLGQTACVACQSHGFECSSREMTYPVAKPGYWVSPKDPTNAHACTLKAGCPGGIWQTPDELDSTCAIDSIDLGSGVLSGVCQHQVGSHCAPGYIQDNTACAKCCRVGQPNCGREVYYQSHIEDVCVKCEDKPMWITAAVLVVVCAVLVPLLLKASDLAKHAGALQAPLLSLVNFFQSAHLFSSLNLHWPAEFLVFVHRVASIFNFALPGERASERFPFLKTYTVYIVRRA